ncbi:MAG: phosphoesterase RecJ-like protein [Planctomycetota bacterium]|jgi:phosphoesterase RecJ-like protein
MLSTNALPADQQAALDLLTGAERVLLTGHQRPDGDCIGAQAALARVLEARGQQVQILNTDAPEPQFDYLSEHLDYAVDDGGPVPEHDLLVLLDCSEISRTGVLEQRFTAAPSKKLVVDHHVLPDVAWWDAAFIDTSAAATGLLVRRIAKALDVELDPIARLGVFTSMVTDTGWFKYSNTDAEVFEAAAEMVAGGVELSTLYSSIYQRRPATHPGQVAKVLSRHSYHADGRIAAVSMPLATDGAAQDFDSEDVLDLLRSVERVEVVLFLRQVKPGVCKLSARSKTDYNVNALARKFGGGGHVKASGATIEGELEQVMARLVLAAEEGFAK